MQISTTACVLAMMTLTTTSAWALSDAGKKWLDKIDAITAEFPVDGVPWKKRVATDNQAHTQVQRAKSRLSALKSYLKNVPKGDRGDARYKKSAAYIVALEKRIPEWAAFIPKRRGIRMAAEKLRLQWVSASAGVENVSRWVREIETNGAPRLPFGLKELGETWRSETARLDAFIRDCTGRFAEVRTPPTSGATLIDKVNCKAAPKVRKLLPPHLLKAAESHLAGLGGPLEASIKRAKSDGEITGSRLETLMDPGSYIARQRALVTPLMKAGGKTPADKQFVPIREASKRFKALGAKVATRKWLKGLKSASGKAKKELVESAKGLGKAYGKPLKLRRALVEAKWSETGDASGGGDRTRSFRGKRAMVVMQAAGEPFCRGYRGNVDQEYDDKKKRWLPVEGEVSGGSSVALVPCR